MRPEDLSNQEDPDNTPTQCLIQVTSGAGGRISPNGDVRVSYGTDQTFTITPDRGYRVANVLVDGKSVGAVTQHTLKDVRTKHTIQVVFTNDVGLPFTDVSRSDWFHEAVEYVYQAGIINGTSDNRFSPDANLTRGMIVQIFYNYNMEGHSAISGANSGNSFTDVARNAWYADAVSWARMHNLVNGYDWDTFGPDDSVTREQLTAILYRYAQYPVPRVYVTAYTSELGKFRDRNQVSSWAQNAMSWAVYHGILQGNPDGTLNPVGKATRSQVAKMMQNYHAAF